MDEARIESFGTRVGQGWVVRVARDQYASQLADMSLFNEKNDVGLLGESICLMMYIRREMIREQI